MSREYDIIIDDKDNGLSQYMVKTEYGLTPSNLGETETGSIIVEEQFEIPLSSDLDIFEGISEESIKSMPRISKFLNELRQSIIDNTSADGSLHYNKLTIEDSSRPGELMIDWIYNYFRAFYSFDDKEGDMYGLIVNNTETRLFKSEFEPLIESEYNEVATKSVRFVIENLLR